MNPEGRITITLSPEPSGGCSTAIASRRPLHASQMFHGKSVAQTLQSLPLLFSICSTAQATAAVRACEQALNTPPQPAVEQAREQLVMMERIREHLWRSLLGWSELLDQPPAEAVMAQVMATQSRMRERLSADGSLFQLAPATPTAAIDDLQQTLSEIVQQSLFGIPAEAWLALETLEQFDHWLNQQQTVATQFIQRLEASGWKDSGNCSTPPLPTLDSAKLDSVKLEQQMEQPHFIAQPEWNGTPCETSALTRSNSPLLRELRQHYGNGLLPRTVARLTELAQTVLQLDHPTLSTPLRSAQSGSGVGSAETARGTLLHRVTVHNQQITAYQILAPTEWNFHPLGVVAQSLNTLPCDAVDLEQQARRIIHAIDPCVGYDLVIQH